VRTTRLRVRLREVEPTVLRVLDVPATSTLPELHLLLQAALGWQNTHLHEFVTATHRYGVEDDDWLDIGSGGRDPLLRQSETGVLLRDLGPRFAYHYDLGDGWEHDVEVLGAGDDQPGCRYGEGGCPPEDSGGPGGYSSLLGVLADPKHPQHGELRAWVGEPLEFDQAAADELVRQTAGVVPDSVRLVLELTAPGVKLTPGGRLPRSFVRQVQQERPDWAWSDKPASREEDLIPLLALHDVLREVGLLRLGKGVLRPIKAAADERQVVRRLRSWFESDQFTDLLAGFTVAELVRRGESTDRELRRVVFAQLRPGWTINGEPLDAERVGLEIARITAVLRGLDLVEYDHPTWRPGPSARTLLPRATALAHLGRQLA
jgi:Plasmid pRiA4b ORF-3-like protein